MSNLPPPNDLTLDPDRPTAMSPPPGKTRSGGGFRSFVLRGLGVVLPPLLTIVVLIWAWNSIESYVLRPIETGVRNAIVWAVQDIRNEIPPSAIAVDGSLVRNGFVFQGTTYIPDPTGRRYFPEYVARSVNENADQIGITVPPPATARAYWHRYVQQTYMPRQIVVPIFLIAFTVVLWFLGRLFTFGIGRWLLASFDSAILRIPLINKVYGSVKQVTDFAFSEREIEFNNVVAVQYPREGMWSIGFATGTSLAQLAEHTGEEMLSVLMPTSPMPMTGFTITVRKSETIELDLTVDEAIQFIVSCGVVVPNGQKILTPRDTVAVA